MTGSTDAEDNGQQVGDVNDHVVFHGTWLHCAGCEVVVLEAVRQVDASGALGALGGDLRANGPLGLRDETVTALNESQRHGQLSLLVLADDGVPVNSVVEVTAKDAPLLLSELVVSSAHDTHSEPARRAAALRQTMSRLQDIALSVPVVSVHPENLPLFLAQLPLATVAPLETETLDTIAEVQAVALRVYGCLETERALAWTVEELGEVAQALRRSESPARLHQELGQLFAWVLCLGNISGVDLASALFAAMNTEVRRQVNKYGTARPYEANAL